MRKLQTLCTCTATFCLYENIIRNDKNCTSLAGSCHHVMDNYMSVVDSLTYCYMHHASGQCKRAISLALNFHNLSTLNPSILKAPSIYTYILTVTMELFKKVVFVLIVGLDKKKTKEIYMPFSNDSLTDALVRYISWCAQFSKSIGSQTAQTFI